MKPSHIAAPRQMRDGLWTAGYVSAPVPRRSPEWIVGAVCTVGVLCLPLSIWLGWIA